MRQNPHVRICGGPGSATTLVYPTTAHAEADSVTFVFDLRFSLRKGARKRI